MTNLDRLTICMVKSAGRGDFALPMLERAIGAAGPRWADATAAARSDPSLLKSIVGSNKGPEMAGRAQDLLGLRKDLAMAARAVHRPLGMRPMISGFKVAATAPAGNPSVGSSFMPGQQSMATMMNSMQDTMSKSPLGAASFNFGGAPGGMQAMLAAQRGMPMATAMNMWKNFTDSNKGHALY